MKIEYIGKTVLLDEKILVIGDLHLGFEQKMRESGIFLPVNLIGKIKEELGNILEYIKINKKIERLEKIIILGDLRHEFGRILRDDWKEVGEIIEFLSERAKEVIVIKGNHDVISSFVVEKFRKVKFVDFYFEDFDYKAAFIHGDKDFREINDKEVKYWFMAHAHPAITIEEKKGSKKEKYKCFLQGKYKDKKVIILPSFFSVNEGTDVLGEFNLGLAWKFDLNNFEVFVIQDEDLEVLNFGKLKKI